MNVYVSRVYQRGIVEWRSWTSDLEYRFTFEALQLRTARAIIDQSVRRTFSHILDNTLYTSKLAIFSHKPFVPPPSSPSRYAARPAICGLAIDVPLCPKLLGSGKPGQTHAFLRLAVCTSAWEWVSLGRLSCSHSHRHTCSEAWSLASSATDREPANPWNPASEYSNLGIVESDCFRAIVKTAATSCLDLTMYCLCIEVTSDSTRRRGAAIAVNRRVR